MALPGYVTDCFNAGALSTVFIEQIAGDLWPKGALEGSEPIEDRNGFSRFGSKAFGRT